MKILAIDDTRDNLITLHALITEAFPESIILTALSGAEGLLMARSEDPDVILLDVFMPGMDGYEVCRQIKSDQTLSDIPVVFLTALSGGTDTRIKALDAGAEGFLSKPVNESELKAQIKAMVKIKEIHTLKRYEKERLSALVALRTAELERELAERRATEQALREKEEKFSKAFQTSPYMITITRASDGKVLEVNDTFCETSGYSKEEALASTTITLDIWVHLEDRDVIIEKLKRGERVTEMECRFRLKDETQIIGSISSQLIMLHNELCIISIIEDITEKKRNLDIIKESRAMLKMILDTIPQSVFWKDPEGKYLGCNQVFARNAGFENPEELIGLTDYDLSWPKQDADAYRADDLSVLTKGEPRLHIVEPLQLANGTRIWIDTSKVPLIVHGDKPTAVLGIFEDISLRKQAEEQLVEMRNRYQSLFDNSLTSTGLVALDGTIVDCNTAYASMLGYTPEEMKSMNAESFYETEEEAIKVGQLLASGQPLIDYETRLKHKNGGWVDVLLNISLIDIQGQWYCQPTCLNITQLKKANAQLRKLSMAVEQSPASVVITDLNGDIEYVNPKFSQVTGYSVEEVLGRNPRILQSGNVFPETYRQMWETLTSGKLWKGEFHNKRKSGELFWEAVSIAPIVDNQGKTTHYLAVKEDITESKLSEMQIRESENRYRNLIENLDIGVVVHAPDTRILLFNKKAMQILGLTVDQMLGRTALDPSWGFIDQFSEKLPIEAYPAVQIATSRKSLYNQIVGLARKSGEGMTWATVNGIPVFTEAGDLSEIIISFADITSLKKAEAELRSNEERFRLLVKNSSDILVMITRDGIQKYISPAASQITGFSPDELIGKSIAEVIHPEDLPEVMKVWHQAIDFPDRLFTVQYRHIHKTRRWVYLEAVGQSFLNEPSVNAGVISVRDVSARIRSETATQVQYNIARSILNIASAAELLEIIRSELGKMVDTSNFMVALYNPENDTLRQLIYCDDNDNFNEWEADQSLSGQVVKLGKTLFLKKSGIEALARQRGLNLLGTRAECWLGVPITIDRVVAGAMVIQSYNDPDAYTMNDVALLEMVAHETGVFLEKQRIMSDLIRAKEKAEESDKLKTAFIQNISHEVRTPLNGIIGFGEFLSEPGTTEEERTTYLNHVRKSSKRLMQTMTDYMDMARIVAGILKVNRKEFSLKKILDQILAETGQEAREKGLALEVSIPEELSNLKLVTDPELFQKSILKLTNNAVKFTEKGSVTISASVDDHTLELAVADTGKGIEPGKVEAMFGMFTQEEMEMTRGYEGSGLGLTIAKGIADLLDGRIRVETEKDKGSIFIFSLPLNGATIKQDTANRQARTVSPMKPLILLAEDDEANYQYMEVVIRKTGCDFLHALNGATAVELCRNHPEITFVLMDIKMPVMNGMEATRLIREFRPSLPVIALTAYAQTGDEQRMLDAGCDEYFPKPILPEILKKLIAKYSALA